MKGVILAGGKGTRLQPCTTSVNKHLLPVYNKPMIMYAVETLKQAGCDQLLIVLGSQSTGDLVHLLQNGKHLGLKNIYYAYQPTSGGISDALSLAREFIAGDPFWFMLGDNILINPVLPDLSNISRGIGHIFLKRVEDPSRFGVADIKNGQLVDLVEKPSVPPSDYAVIGLYHYDSNVFDLIDQLSPSDRGELEITDLNKLLLKQNLLQYAILDCAWLDTGTFDSLLLAGQMVKRS